jgi:hypothetical protein
MTDEQRSHVTEASNRFEEALRLPNVRDCGQPAADIASQPVRHDNGRSGDLCRFGVNLLEVQ